MSRLTLRLRLECAMCEYRLTTMNGVYWPEILMAQGRFHAERVHNLPEPTIEDETDGNDRVIRVTQ